MTTKTVEGELTDPPHRSPLVGCAARGANPLRGRVPSCIDESKHRCQR